MKSILHDFYRIFIEENKMIFLEGESPILIMFEITENVQKIWKHQIIFDSKTFGQDKRQSAKGLIVWRFSARVEM